jgi:hypothetical protein
MFKKIGFWITILFLMLAVVSLLMYFIKKDTYLYAENIIAETSLSFKGELTRFLGVVDTSVENLQADTETVDIDLLPADSLHLYFSKFITNEALLRGVILFGSKMNYIMIREQNSWIVTHNFLTDSIINWQRLDKDLHKLSDWTETYNAFMDAKNFGKITIPEALAQKYVWLNLKSEVKERRDLLLNIFRLNTKDGVDFVALAYKTGDLSNQFKQVLRFENPLVSIFTTGNEIVSPMLTDDTTRMEQYSELETEVRNIIKTWRKTGSNKSHSYIFNKFKQDYWCRIDTIKPYMGVEGFAVTISDNDLLNAQKKLNQAYLYAAITFLLFALFVFLTSYRKQTPKPKRALFKELNKEEVIELIEKGETEFVEFKSSLRWDFREEKPNKILEDVILKSVAAFSNAKGGTLFIGVTDELEIIGLEHDFKTLKKQDADYFELHLRKLINNQYGIQFANKHLLIHFPEFNGKIICVLQVSVSDKPLYLKVKNKQGHEVEKFYVRSGNASQEITLLKEINEYVAGHFKVED